MTVKIEWYSGTGKGGQHRNKHQNCCRVVHVETGLRACGTESKSRETNKRAALKVLKARVAAYYHSDKERGLAGKERVRTYHMADNRVNDHASGQQFKYTDIKDNIAPAINARRLAMIQREPTPNTETE